MDLKNNKGTLAAIKFINNATPTTSETEWMNIVQNFGNNSTMQEIMMQSPYIPDKCIEYLIYNKKLQPKIALNALKKDYLRESTVKLSIASSTSLWELRDYIKYCYDAEIKIPDKNLIWLYSLPHDDIKTNCLKSISNEHFIKSQMQTDLSEEFLTAIADNKFINDELRMEAFNSGADFLRLENPTKEMADDMCISLMGTVFDDVIDKNDSAMQLVRSACLERLVKLARQNSCSFEMQLELLNKCEEVCKSNKDHGVEDLYATLMQYTSEPQILAHGCDSKVPNIRHFALCNNHLDKYLSAAITDVTLGELQKSTGYDHTSNMAIVSMMIKRTPLSYWAYDNIIRNNYTQLLTEIAMSEHTPVEQLNELIGHKNQKIARIAEFNLKALHSGSLYRNEFNKALNAFEINGTRDSDNILVLRLPQLLEEIKTTLLKIAEKTTAQPMKDSIPKYINEMVKASEFEMAKKYCGLFKYSKDLDCMILEYEKVPNLSPEHIKECLEKLSDNHLEQLIKEIEFEYFVVNTVDQYKMFEGKEIILEKINEILKEREKETPEKEVREDGIEI